MSVLVHINVTGCESLQRCQLSNYEFTWTSAQCAYKQGNCLTAL